MDIDSARPEMGETEFLESLTASLSNTDRRSILRVLQQRTESVPLPVERLATELVARDRDVPGDAVTDEQANRRRTMLYHCHLPKLHQAAVIDWDREGERVSLADSQRVREALSTLLPEPESRRSSPDRKWGSS
ncbi:DUF7344 domain-containing protein (plasmid) [Haloarcula salina]|uniref:DUF7344 domain-containing protein n=1 Tax=Haloarcula salina TaxID=1429914 RepID=UPI003C6FFC1D